jgi:uncharacterized protein YdeI (YjbR/CyaY-like superfamily)
VNLKYSVITLTKKEDNIFQVKLPVISFNNSIEWKKWLSVNHSNSNGIWIRFFKKDSNPDSVTHDEALDEALCYGWIDGQLKKYDDKSWLQKFTPRRPKSIWSKRNADRAVELIKLKKMESAGQKEIDSAKEDGRWDKAYDSPGKMRIPDDFIREISKNKKAFKFYKTLNRANLYSIAWRLQTAKKPETRAKRMDKIIDMLSRGEKFH